MKVSLVQSLIEKQPVACIHDGKLILPVTTAYINYKGHYTMTLCDVGLKVNTGSMKYWLHKDATPIYEKDKVTLEF